MWIFWVVRGVITPNFSISGIDHINISLPPNPPQIYFWKRFQVSRPMWWAWKRQRPQTPSRRRTLRKQSPGEGNGSWARISSKTSLLHHAKMRLESCHLKILSLLRLKNHPKTKKKKRSFHVQTFVHQTNWKKWRKLCFSLDELDRLRIGSGPAAYVASPPWRRAGWSWRVGSSWLWMGWFLALLPHRFHDTFSQGVFGSRFDDLRCIPGMEPNGQFGISTWQETCMSAFPSNAHEMSAIKPSMVVSFRRQAVSTGCPLYPIANNWTNEWLPRAMLTPIPGKKAEQIR